MRRVQGRGAEVAGLAALAGAAFSICINVIFTVRRGQVAAVAMKPVSPWTDFSFDYGDLHFRPADAKR